MSLSPVVVTSRLVGLIRVGIKHLKRFGFWQGGRPGAIVPEPKRSENLMDFSRAERKLFDIITPTNIWQERQNHPELVVEDARELLGLDDFGADTLRAILLRRGVNKWLYCRTLLIRHKHEMKKLFKLLDPKSEAYRVAQKMYEPLHRICHMPRYILWGTHVHKKMQNNISECQIKKR